MYVGRLPEGSISHCNYIARLDLIQSQRFTPVFVWVRSNLTSVSAGQNKKITEQLFLKLVKMTDDAGGVAGRI